MWEFFFRKKETPATSVPEVVSAPRPESAAATIEQTTERGNEGAYEKYAAILTQAAVSTQVTPVEGEVAADVQVVSKGTDAASRVTQLVELAQVKGVAHAVEVARKMNDLYVLDTMHDELADKLYEALKTKGLIQGE